MPVKMLSETWQSLGQHQHRRRKPWGYWEVCMRILFRKKQAQSERMPPTQGAQCEAVLRAHQQVTVWNNDIVATPDIPLPKTLWLGETRQQMATSHRHQKPSFTLLNVAARNDVQETNANAAKMGCRAQTSVLVIMRRINCARIFLAKL